MPLGSTRTRSKPRIAMEMSLVRIRRWWVSQSHPPLMVSISHRSPSRSCTSMASTFTAPKSFSKMQTLCPCATRYAAYLRKKVVFPAPRKPVIRSTCTIFFPSAVLVSGPVYSIRKKQARGRRRAFPLLVLAVQSLCTVTLPVRASLQPNLAGVPSWVWFMRG